MMTWETSEEIKQIVKRHTESIPQFFDEFFHEYPNLRKMCETLSQREDFRTAMAAKKNHHAYPGGLVVHSVDVILISLANLTSILDGGEYIPAAVTLTTAGLYHDYAKVHEIEFAPIDEDEDEFEIQSTPYVKRIGHISGSHAKFMQDANSAGLNDKEWELVPDIEHCILSHHGRKEWGSPVLPQTREALIFHQADMLSSRFGSDARRNPDSPMYDE